ncbi:MAG: hypothetical protein M1151_01620 [Candidatus Thermoplasmatota archaeon]|nr:hypothetical protein [Candidatus Thermoplasmatota archaeon]MCL5785353.1 hypothetical protein [Candidatus Thermoplasmatota archaeon]
MLIEDHRNISCGGDPFNYLRSVMKGLSIQLDPGQDATVLLLSEKFPYDEPFFKSMSEAMKLNLVEMRSNGTEVSLHLRKMQASQNY